VKAIVSTCPFGTSSGLVAYFFRQIQSTKEQIKMSPKIVFADDHDHIRVLLEQTLEEFEDDGAELFPASNGAEAWEIVQAQRPDVVILDVMMPGLTGFEVCDHIKSDPNFSHAHVIMLTARGQARDYERGVEVGADEYITKPFSPKRLIRLVADVLPKVE
jgi:CheY-like chemotaxis protein